LTGFKLPTILKPVYVTVYRVFLTMPQPHHLAEPGDLSEYDRDLVAWATENAALLRAGKLDRIDTAHIAEELEDLGRRERRALGNHLWNLVMHLLEWEFQPERRTGSWRSFIETLVPRSPRFWRTARASHQRRGSVWRRDMPLRGRI